AAQGGAVGADLGGGRDRQDDYDARGGETEFVSGFYGRRTHDVVDFNECLIQNRTNNEVFQALNALVAERAIPVYGGDAPEPGAGAPRTVSRCREGSAPACGGALKHLVVRCTRDGEQALAVLGGCGGPLRDVERAAYELMLTVPKLVGVVEETEPARDPGEGAGGGREPSRGGGRRQLWRAAPRVVRGAGFLRERILGLEFMVSADSFLQVNPEGMEVLYGEALRAADLSGDEVALDAYCGVGSISLALARECRHVYGIEEVNAAVADARRNAGLNRLTNCAFIVGRVEDVLSARFGFGIDVDAGGGAAASPGCEPAESRGHAPGRGRQAGRKTSPLPCHVDVVVLDPPRAGCDVRALRALALLEPSRMVYVSCDPETLARDLGILAGIGYRPTLVQPVDMFPQTSHVESVVRLMRS
ncbi:MAG: class I SAM-dependent RNA methyltransferase, partial [Clostridia bacterium]